MGADMLVRFLMMGLCLLAADVALAGDRKSLEAQKTFETVTLEIERRRAALLDQVLLSSRLGRQVAWAELRGGFSDDPEVVAALIQTLADDQSGADLLASDVRDEVVIFLRQAREAAWTPDLVEHAQEVLSGYASSARPAPGGTAELAGDVTALAGARAAFGEVQPRIEGKVQFTDVDVFVCEYAADDAALVQSARRFSEEIAAADFGRVRLRPASAELAEDERIGTGVTTLLLDKGHAEERALDTLPSLVEKAGLPELRIETNEGAPSFWYLSIFVCP